MLQYFEKTLSLKASITCALQNKVTVMGHVAAGDLRCHPKWWPRWTPSWSLLDIIKFITKVRGCFLIVNNIYFYYKIA